MLNPSDTVGPMNDSPSRQRQLIERAAEILHADDRVIAAYLIGSHAAGTADEYSDIDLHCVVSDEDFPSCLADLDKILDDIAGPLVLVDAIPGISGALAITADWQHLDIVIHAESEYDPDQYDAVKPMFDRSGSLLPGARVPTATAESADFPYGVVNIFFYFLGQLVTVLGREELVVAHSGIVVVRGKLVELMYAERGVRPTGGVKRLNPFLSDEQRAVLEAVPAAGADREQIIATHRYLTENFIKRGKRLADETGATWPQDLEDATLAHLRRHLGVDFAVPPA